MSNITMRLGKLSATVAPAAPPVLAEDGTDITELVALVRDGTDAQKENAAGALESLAHSADKPNSHRKGRWHGSARGTGA